jgi:hypothetical protein
MKDKRLEQQLQDSLNRTLSGVRTTSFQREQFFENATGGRKVKRKLTYSLSLALIIALMLATMGVAFVSDQWLWHPGFCPYPMGRCGGSPRRGKVHRS